MKYGDACEACVRRRRQNQKGNIMNTQETVNQSYNFSAALHTNDNSAPSVSPELVTDIIYHILRFQRIPKEGIEILSSRALAGDLPATYCLMRKERSCNLPYAVESAIYENVDLAAKMEDPLADFMRACEYLYQSKFSDGLRLLNKLAEEGVQESIWQLALYEAGVGGPKALDYCLKAAEAGYEPAKAAHSIAQGVIAVMEEELKEKNRDSFNALHGENRELIRTNEALRVEHKASLDKHIQQIVDLQKRCESAESKLASLTVEALKDEAIGELQASTKKAEEDWLEAKCAQETAEAMRIKAERLADDLTRRNKHLVGLLRKKGIPFNEYESSSSDMGISHLGLAS